MNERIKQSTAANMKRGGSDRNIIVVKEFLPPDEAAEMLDSVLKNEWTPGSPAATVNPDKVENIQLESMISLLETIASTEYGTNALRYDDVGLFNKWNTGDYVQRHLGAGISPDTGTIDIEDFIGSGIVAPPPAIMYSAILHLNDDYEGGEVLFPKQSYSIKPEAGTLILFPATCMYPLEVRKITSGTKYTYSLHLSDATIADVFLQLIRLVEKYRTEE